MVLLFFTPESAQTVYFKVIPALTIVHGVLFWGFVHIWMSACKKQGKYEIIRKNAFKLVFFCALILIAILELLVYLITETPPAHILWNIGFDLFGSVLGLLSFRVLYANCY
jgi:hypothetical protein